LRLNVKRDKIYEKGRLIRLIEVTWCANVDCSCNEQMTLHRPTNYRREGERIIDVGILCRRRLSAGYLTTVDVNGRRV